MKSLKNTISTLVLFSIIMVSIIIGIISIISFNDMKINSVKHSQQQVIKQVKSQANHLLNKIEKISNYIIKNYKVGDTLLKNVVELNSDISSILILNKEGRIIDFYAKSNDHIYKGFDYSNKTYFKSVNKFKSSSWSNVFFSSVDNKPSISYTLKKDNKVLVIILRLDIFSNFITKLQNNDNSHMIRILDQNGIFIFNPDSINLVNQRFNAKNSSIYNDLINKNSEFNLAKFKNSNSNDNNFGMYTKLEKTGWTIVIRENYDLVLNTLKGFLISLFFVVLLFILFILYFVFKLFTNIFKQFDYLQETTKDISNGKYNKKIEKSTFKEISELIGSFEKMKTQINNREKHLKNSRDSFEFLFNSTMEAIIIHDTKYCIDVNDITLKLLGANSKDEIKNKSIFDFIANSSIQTVKRKILKDNLPYEVELKKLNGEVFTALIQGKFVELNSKRLKITNIVDISELKNKDKLIFQQSKMVSMGEMIGNIAHQWRQPLSSISTAASGIKIEKEFGILDDKSLENSLNMIIKNTKYLSKTIDDFRNFFKVDKEKESIDISFVINKALKLLESSFKNHYIDIQKEFSNDLFIKGYKNELTQALINIINNAKDALKELNHEDRLINIHTYLENDIVVISIKDNAGGIKKSIKSKIFEPYFTTKHQKQGTGIGLYMTHQIIVDHMNGKIDVNNIKINYKNSEYIGCEFKIYFDYLKNT
ncbi:hypothetical protein CPU12_07275 [Malaciobacter molluscorum LMG 25693]|uniref:histidine kinase n=1 Tax=Malaciobacter molluscorum LMG 25693 TaxID=870501 RepID=A0A2G1DHS5_9BACT|nr:cache domain-containing protein [Malaciobacter molluscorum]AXX93002.1 Cache sensor-containing signal transduction histidine kinase [Malaciobacter molluscorum LMG 25693]PHO18059.1 hypothetical protein CPU12_07275 [Malaciobacter molluscorum LMG 25693]